MSEPSGSKASIDVLQYPLGLQMVSGSLQKLPHSSTPIHQFPTIEEYVGNTPLVKLQRLSSNPSNVVLAKLEGNNPAGSVKDRWKFVCT